MQDTRAWSLGWEDPLEKGKATHSSVLARRIPGTEEPGRLQSTGSQRVRRDWATSNLRQPSMLSLGHLPGERSSEWTWDPGLHSLVWTDGDRRPEKASWPWRGDLLSTELVCIWAILLDQSVWSERKHGIFSASERQISFLFFSFFFLILWHIFKALLYFWRCVLFQGLHWWSSGLDSALPMQGAWVWSLLRELDFTCCN